MIKINGVGWRVRLVSPSNPFLISSTGRLALGSCDNTTKTIYLSKGIPRKKLKKVLCHELVHAVMFSYQVLLNPEQEEIFADLFASYGEQIIDFTNTIYLQIK